MSLVPYYTYNKELRPRRSSVTQNHQAYMFPSPTKGIDVTQQLAGGDPLTATVLENLVPGVQGVVLRKGYSLWQAALPAPVRTILNWIPSAAGFDPNIFAALENGEVYDISTRNQVAPPLIATLPGQVDPGNMSFINFTTEAGSFLCVVAEGEGYFTWDGTTWVQRIEGVAPGEIEGIDPAEFAFIWEWGKRIWFVQRDSMSVWYLPVGQLSGEATELPLGPLATNGGSMYMGVNWTVDGGGGDSGSSTSMSNKLVFITNQGDIFIYGGTDPDNASSFQLEGKWFIGRIPEGRRAVSRFGSDVVILSERGLSFLSELLRGQGFFDNAGLGERINSSLAPNITNSLSARYWEIKFLPTEQLILINVPTLPGERPWQWAFITDDKAFTTFYGMPMLTVARTAARPLFGDFSGNVWVPFEGDSDGSTEDTRGMDIEGVMLTSFQPMGDAIQQKRALLTKMQMTAPEPPAVQMQLNMSFTRAQPLGSPVFSFASNSLWNNGLWNQAVWAGFDKQYTTWVGAVGVGPFAALSMKIRGLPGTRIVTWMAVVEAGGILGI